MYDVHNQLKPDYAAKHAGFTLMELMIVVAIVAILAGIAYPSYQRYVMQSHRTEAQTAMVQTAQYVERKYSSTFSYPSSVPNSITMPGTVSDYYTVVVTYPTAGQTFLITATKTSRQNDPCSPLTLDEKGQKTPTTDGCWK